MSDKSCPFCGAGGWIAKGESCVYSCSTIVEPHRAGQSVTCVAKERDILRQRVDAALKVLNRISEFGDWVQWDDVADVVEILTGNSPINLEGSP